MKGWETKEVLSLWLNPDYDFELSDYQAQKLRTLKAVYSWMLETPNQLKIVSKVERTFDVSTKTAYEYIKEAQYIFGNPIEADKAARKAHFIQILYRQIEEAEKYEQKNVPTLMKLLAEVEGFNRDEADIPDPDTFQVPPVIIGSFPNKKLLPPEEELDKILLELSNKVEKKKIYIDAEDVDHEDITERS